MRGILRGIIWLVCAAIVCSGAWAGAEGVTLNTVSIFGGLEAGAQAYVDILADWESATGNRVEDRSAPSDEKWKASVLNDFAAGNEPDILFYFAATADSSPLLDKVVPISEINAAYPGLNLTENEALREADEQIYAIPVRPFVEGLYVNLDLFRQYELALPTTVATFETAIATFRQEGIVPIAISLSDIPHYLVELAILSSGPVSDHQARPTTVEAIPASWVRGMELIAHLYDIGAFPRNVNATTNDLTQELFLEGKAAMVVEGSWFANAIEQKNWSRFAVMPFPAYSEEADPKAAIGGITMGFYLTRKAWEDDARRDAAVALLATLTSESSCKALGFVFGGELSRSTAEMMEVAKENGTLVLPIGDAMDLEARNHWFNQIPMIADGSEEIEDVLAEMIRLKPYEIVD